MTTVRTITTHFSDINLDAGSYRGISVCLAIYELPEEAIKYVNKALDIVPPENRVLRFYLTKSLYRIYTALAKKGDEIGKKENENATKYIDQAISTLPLDWHDSKELLREVVYGHYEKAEHLKAIDKREAAIQAYEDCRAVQRGDSIINEGLILQMMVNIWDEKYDPNGFKVTKMIKGWTDKERLTWFEYIFGYYNWYDFDGTDKLDQVAIQNGEDGKKFVLQCYDNFMKTLQPRSAHHADGGHGVDVSKGNCPTRNLQGTKAQNWLIQEPKDTLTNSCTVT